MPSPSTWTPEEAARLRRYHSIRPGGEAVSGGRVPAEPVAPAAPRPPSPLLNGGRCAAQHKRKAIGWVQCTRKPRHDGPHRWGTDNRVTPAEPSS